jgi:hypothetical protein
MSTWYQVKDTDYIELSDDKKSIYIDVTETLQCDVKLGTVYLEIPVEFIKKLIKE